MFKKFKPKSKPSSQTSSSQPEEPVKDLTDENSIALRSELSPTEENIEKVQNNVTVETLADQRIASIQNEAENKMCDPLEDFLNNYNYPNMIEMNSGTENSNQHQQNMLNSSNNDLPKEKTVMNDFDLIPQNNHYSNFQNDYNSVNNCNNDTIEPLSAPLSQKSLEEKNSAHSLHISPASPNAMDHDQFSTITKNNELTDAKSTSASQTKSWKAKKTKVSALFPELLDENVDTFDLPLRELVHKIPRNNPIIDTKSIKSEKSSVVLSELDENSESVSKQAKLENEENEGPQLTVDAEGNLVLNQNTLYIKPKSNIVLADQVLFEDEYEHKNYSRRREKNGKWRKSESKKFYLLLRMIGSNFTDISRVLKTKSPKQVKNKYIAECKVNVDLINQALKSSIPFDQGILDSLDEVYNEAAAKKRLNI